jgi:hypothetical protein
MRLQQHFRDARGTTEIAVNLKGRMRIEHVWIRALRIEQHSKHGMRVISLSEPCPNVDSPAKAPTRCFIASNIEGPSCSGGEFRSVLDRNLIGGMQRI